MAARPGHAANVAFAKKIKSLIKKERGKKKLRIYDPNTKPVYDTVQIMEILPHRPPMLLIDKIIELTKTNVVGVKAVTMNEPYFVGHFPGCTGNARCFADRSNGANRRYIGFKYGA